MAEYLTQMACAVASIAWETDNKYLLQGQAHIDSWDSRLLGGTIKIRLMGLRHVSESTRSLVSSTLMSAIRLLA